MEYKIDQKMLDNVINIVALAKQTGLNYLELTQIIKQLQTLPKIEEAAIKEKTPQVISRPDIAPVAPVEKVMPEKAVIVRSKPKPANGINNG